LLKNVRLGDPGEFEDFLSDFSNALVEMFFITHGLTLRGFERTAMCPVFGRSPGGPDATESAMA
jgi:hypothetical protein